MSAASPPIVSAVIGMMAWCSFLPTASAAATEGATTEPPAIRLSGFGTVALTRSSSREAGFVQDLGQPKGSNGQWTPRVDSKLGVQLNAKLSESVEGVVQAISRYRYDKSIDPEISWAFIKADLSPQLSLRAGRLGTEFFMLADSRLVSYSYLTVRPPVDYFSVLPINHIDGMDASYTTVLSGGLLRGKVFAGAAGEKLDVIGETWNLTGSPMRGASLDFQRGPWLFRLGYTEIKFNREMPNAGLLNGLELAGFGTLSSNLSVKNKSHRLNSFGVVYDEGPLQAQLMLGYTRRDSAAFENTHNGYLLAGYRMGAVTPFGGISWIYSASKPRDPALAAAPPLAAGVDVLMNDAHSDQHTVFFGGRWDIAPSVALKAQVDIIRGTGASRFTVRDDSPNWNGRTNVFTLSADFIF